jgi:hypothetical protein
MTRLTVVKFRMYSRSTRVVCCSGDKLSPNRLHMKSAKVFSIAPAAAVKTTYLHLGCCTMKHIISRARSWLAAADDATAAYCISVYDGTDNKRFR